jgi:phytoene desaturase
LHHNCFSTKILIYTPKRFTQTPNGLSKPLFYVSAPSKLTILAPEDDENLFVLIPIAPDLEDGEEVREKILRYCDGKAGALCSAFHP